MTDLKIDPESLKALVLKAILESWDNETRDKLVSDALAHLLGTSTDRYGNRSPNVIEQAMREAIHQAANKACRQLIEDSPEYQEKINEAVLPIADVFFNSDLNLEKEIVETLVAEYKRRRGY